MVNKKIQGKKNRQAGARFELKVRKDLESKGWIVDKWSNNVEFISKKLDSELKTKQDAEERANIELSEVSGKRFGKLVKVKNKFRGKGIPMMLGAGFPDFVCFKLYNVARVGKEETIVYEVIGVEAKSNGYLDKVEKEKCRWLLNNNIFSKILIASKGTKRGQIVYKEFEGP